MVVRVKVFTDDITRFRQKNRGFIENTPAIEEENSREFAQDLVTAIKRSIDRTFSTDGQTGKLRGNVKSTRRSGDADFAVEANAYNSRSGVNYAAWHEYAENGHFVPFESKDGTKNIELIRWAQRVGIDTDSVFGLEVSPKSFMQSGVKSAIDKSRKKMQSGDNAALDAIDKTFGN
jgi:hypothetical protein